MQDQNLPQQVDDSPHQAHTGTIPLRQVVTRPAWNYYDRISHNDPHDSEHPPMAQIGGPSQLSQSLMDSTEVPRKRRRYNLTPKTEVPPPLAPSVEEAYRRKCIQLKTRLNEIEVSYLWLIRAVFEQFYDLRMFYNYWIILLTEANSPQADNDATRLRVQRIERTIQKQRIERAFLLEQLAKRTSTNVEDSEGSPSPPPTVNSTPMPV
jgi:hypothetical protein